MASGATTLIVGIDEAGRGALAGPVVAAAAVMTPQQLQNPPEQLKDSKQLTPEQRYQLRQWLLKNLVDWSLAIIWNETIDYYNIAQATYQAMFKALKRLRTWKQIQSIWIDGKFFPLKHFQKIPIHCLVKGDSKHPCIAAASILAKTFRDDVMTLYHHLFPQYNWKTNKGYPTLFHKTQLQRLGPSPLHRFSFKPVCLQKQLFEEQQSEKR